MHFADPLQVVCPSCGKDGGYAPRELVALRSRCSHCSSSLELVGREMRAHLSSWSGYLAKIDMAIDLERAFALEVPDAELDAMKTPLDVLQFYRARSAAATSAQDLESKGLGWLSQARLVPVSAADLQREFTELFAVEEHP